MKKVLLAAAVAIAAFAAGGVSNAHECTYDGDEPDTGNQVECHESPVAPNWRDGNYVPLFDISDRNDPDQRKNAQRWREECQSYGADGSYRSDQLCAWARGGYSHTPGHGQTAPNELHAGFAATHCFLGEFAHQCEDHDARHGESVHDKHGGATYADVCLMENRESKYCDDGPTDTQAGLTVMDHFPCGLIVPIVACIDEYHVVRPLDTDYTTEQMNDSAEYIPRIIADPELYLCGYEQYRGGLPICPSDDDESAGSGASSVRSRAAAGAPDVRDGASPPATRIGLGIARIDSSRALASSTGLPRDGADTAAGAWMLMITAAALLVRARRATN